MTSATYHVVTDNDIV